MCEKEEKTEQVSRYSSLPISRFERNQQVDEQSRQSAMRTAFVARFIVLREGRRTRAHRVIETMIWDKNTSADELYKRFRQAFIDNGDNLKPVDRDLRRAMDHARCSAAYFVEQYIERQTLSFQQALDDYERSNKLLFGEGDEVVPRVGGWRILSVTSEN